MKRSAFLALVVAAACPRFVLAQATATQGATASETGKRTEFTSPMVLDIPFPDFRELPPGKDWITTSAREYSCDGVSLESLTVVPGRARKVWLLDGRGKERVVEYMLQTKIRVQPSRDRTVGLRAELRHGDRTLASTTFHDIDAEEEKVTGARVYLVARAVDIESMFTGDAKPMLHLTMSVK